MNAEPLYRARRHTISLTALIDVVFILLLFFMLSFTFTQWRAVDLHSPTSSFSEDVQLPQIVWLDEVGGLRFHDSTFSVAHYKELTDPSIFEFEFEKSHVVLPEENANLQTILSAIESLKRIGLKHVTLGNSFSEKTE